MENKLKKILFSGLLLFLSILLVVIISEVAFECYKFQKEHSGHSALLMEISQRLDFLGKNEPKEGTSYRNPFIEYDSSLQFRLHPFIGFSGVQGHVDELIRWDYFGFRNNQNLYFTDKDYKLVVITGGSEVAGQSHRRTIAQNLEDKLNKRGSRKYKVLNLAMNSYTISDEINAYVHLAYHLRPEFVISHTGYNDMLYSLMVPLPFRKLGLNYFDKIELWLPRLYDLIQPEDVKPPLDIDYPNVTMEGFIGNLKKYKTIVEGNGGRFIVGIQGHDIKAITHDRPYHEAAIDRMLTLNYKLRQEDYIGYKYIDFHRIKDIDYVDPVHSTEKSSNKIADIYADLILEASQDGNVQSPTQPAP